MRRPLLAVSFSLLAALPLACTERVIVHKAAAGGDAAAPEDEEPVDAGPEEPTPTGAIEIDLGEVPLNRDIPFEVPDGALGFNVVLEGSAADFDPNAPFGVDRIVDPDGKTVHSNFAPVGGDRPSTFAAFDAIATASVPQSEAARAPLPGGTWKVRFGQVAFGETPRKLTAKVTVQTSGDGEFHGGVLDLHLHVPKGLRIDGRSIDAENAEDDRALEERVDLFFRLTSQLLGIERGKVSYYVERAGLADIDGIEELLEGFSISRGAADGSQELHVMLTNSISDQGQPFAAGISPGIPGAANRFGRGNSGIIVTLDGGLEQGVLTMLHEAGHFFGLNHTTEFDARSADPLKDTPRCTDLSHQAIFDCPDRENVMFPAGPLAGPVTLSPTQKRVYRGSPIYKAFSKGAMRTRSASSPITLPPRQMRASGQALTPVEQELSLGFCGLNRIDAAGMVQRYGRDAAIAQLRSAAKDTDLDKVIRGRANLALKQLGVAVE